PCLPDFEAGRKDVCVPPLVLLRPGLGRAGENCAIDRAVQTRLPSRPEACFPRLAGIASAVERRARSGGEGGEAPYCRAVFADERHSRNLARGCRNNRARSLVWSRTRNECGT